MRLQLLSDLHLETEDFEPVPAPDAELLVLAGDIDSSWAGFERFRDWPVPVLLIAGNHEFDGRDIAQAWPALRTSCADLGITLIECESRVLVDKGGRRIRLLGTTRWCDYDLYGEPERERCMRAGSYFQRVMRAHLNGVPFGPEIVRAQALACRDWLAQALRQPDEPSDATLVVTHFAPSLRSADPRYGHQPGTASFCNADDDLLRHADVWIHGHLHCRHDYRVEHTTGSTRVVSNARGHTQRGEVQGHLPMFTLEI